MHCAGRLRVWLLVVLSLWLAMLPSSSAVQFCKQDDDKSVDICIATTTVQDTSSKDVNSHILFSTNFKKRQGWTGFGIGKRMSGALMFVLYPAEDPDGRFPSAAQKHGYQ